MTEYLSDDPPTAPAQRFEGAESRTRWATAARVSRLATANVASRRSGEFGRCFLYQGWYDLVPRLGLGLTCPGATPGADQRHQQLVLWGTNRTYAGGFPVLPAQRLIPSATGVVQGWQLACHRRRVVALSWAMSSRLAARAAARSWSRSSSWSRRSVTCCSRWVIVWLRASMSAGAPSPESRQACSPSVSDRRFSSCWTRALSRTARSWAASRSACSDARVTAGPAVLAGGRRGGFERVDLAEQVAVPVEEGAVHGGGAGDGGDADLGAVGGGAC